MLTQLTSFTTFGLACQKIIVEIGSLPGEAEMCIVGLGDTAVQESKQRVRLALRTSGFKLPTGRSITVNLAPADVKKIGPRFDLPIALGMILAHGLADVPPEALARTAFLGELSLDGMLRHVTGVLSAAIACREHGMTRLVVPAMDAAEASLIPGIEVIAAEHLRDVVDILAGTKAAPSITPPDPDRLGERHPESLIDFSDVRGQEHAKRALEIAAAGGHNVLLCGSPGSGKTLLARALPGILPRLSRDESIEVTQIYSVANKLSAASSLIEERPFRVVHHTASAVSIVGGGQIPGPGEISLAHKGVMFLDELAEFPPPVLEVLRQPLEDRKITITRAHGSVTFPADFILVAAMNPPEPGQRRNQKRISAPLLDRIDLTIAVDPVPIEDLSRAPTIRGTTSAEILARVSAAREHQRLRFQGMPISTNKEMSVQHIDLLCTLDAASLTLLTQAAKRMNLSARSYHRTIKVARTIADLAGSVAIEAVHIAEALQYRQPLGLEASS